MTASYNFVIDTGTVVADTSTLQADVQAEFQNALGQNIDLASSTPQGTMIGAETIARTSVMKNNADVANVINPDLSYGVFLDAICAFLGTQRGRNKSTQGNGIQLDGDGVTTVTVPAGSRVQTPAGDVFVIESDTVIAGGGTVLTNVLSQEFGIVPLPVGPLTIVDGTIGWGDAIVIVGTVVVPGTLALTDPQLKIARNRQLAAQGIGSSAAIISKVSQADNVTSATVVENNTGAVGTINGVTFSLPNAMWACVAGTASDSDIANALYASHGGGCPWDYGAAGQGVPIQSPNGVQVFDPATGLPYRVKANRPVELDAYVKISVHQTNFASYPALSVQNAILAYANGEEAGEPGLVAGASISAFEMAGAVSRQLPGMYIKACSVAAVTAGSPAPVPGDYSSEVVLAPYQQGVITSGRILVTIV